jgi:single-stranded DNA-binding protein
MILLKGSSLTCFIFSRTLVYLEGDATMRTYGDAEGKKQSSLSLVQTKLEVLKRPAPAEAPNA